MKEGVAQQAAEVSTTAIKENWLPGSVLTVQKLNDIELAPGVYLAAGFSRRLIGHAFVIQVVGTKKLGKKLIAYGKD